jgi:hypothetical protein
MGFEDFRAELRGGRATSAEAAAVVRALPHVKPDPHSLPLPGSTYYVLNDGQHVLEIEVGDAPVRLSCRFTLCHPPSVDGAFLRLVRELMRPLGMEASIRDDVRPEHARPFALQEFAEFSALTTRYIAARRAEWIGAFGDQPLAATTNEVYERIILPQCQPVVAGAPATENHQRRQ